MDHIFRHVGHGGATPPVHDRFSIGGGAFETADDAIDNEPEGELHPIAGFTCVIDYVDSTGKTSERLITCRTYEVRGGRQSICAICHVRRAFRRFRLDRIEAVYDAESGEFLGGSDFFARFSRHADRERPSAFGLPRSRRRTLVAGLNILTFMARCDGQWHSLEEQVIGDFVERLWEQKGWDGAPPMCDVMDHARKLAPDRELFFRSIEAYARSSSSAGLILDATEQLVAADGIIVREEFDWGVAMREALEEARQREPGWRKRA